MKKVMMIAAIAAALVSCQSKGTQNNDSAVGEGVLTVAGNDSSAVAVYEGLLPAADGPGIQYDSGTALSNTSTPVRNKRRRIVFA